MAASALLCLLLLAPPTARHKLAYRFEKGTTYDEETTRSFTLTLLAGPLARPRMIRYVNDTDELLRRTVIDTDANGRPIQERVQVIRSTRTIKEAPDRGPGVEKGASHAKTFVWKKLDGRWGLFDAKGEVTRRFPGLAARLQSWRDARLPAKPVAVGDRWEVSAAKFLATVGQPVPKDLKGRAVFSLLSVKQSVARIGVELRLDYRDGGHRLAGTQKGVWRFDIARGRDLSIEMKGILDVDGGKRGDGIIKMRRVVTWPESSSKSTPGDGSSTSDRKPGSR